MKFELRRVNHRDWRQLSILMPAIFPELTKDLVASYLCYRSHSMGVATIDKRIIGFYQFDPAKTVQTAWLNYFGVSSNNQRLSMGKNLLQYFEQHAVSMGYTRADLHVRQENTSAQKFYEKNGYHFVEIHPETTHTDFLYAKTFTTVSVAPVESKSHTPKRAIISSLFMRIRCKFYYGVYIAIPRALSFPTRTKK